MSFVKESWVGLLWAILFLSIVFCHYTMCVDIPEFRYLGY